MAEETVIIEVEIDNEAARKNAAELTARLAQQRKELARLKKDFDLGKVSQDQFGKEAAALQREINQSSEALRDNQKAAVTNSDSINALRISVARLTKERNNLDTSTAEGAQRFAELTTVIKNQVDTLKELEAAAGDTRRNVGNYKEAITEALGETNLFGDEIGGLINGFKGFVSGIKTGVAGLNTFKAALIGTGIGALIIALGSVVTFFTRTRKGAETLERALGAINGVISVLINQVAAFGENIINFITNPIETAKNAFSGFADVVTGFFEDPAGTIEKGIDRIKGFTDELARGAQEGAKAAEQNIKNRQAIRELTAAQAEATFQAERFRKQRDDETKSEAERLALNQKVLEFEQKRTAAQTALVNKRIQLVNNEIAARGGLANATEEQLDQLAELERERFDILEDFEGRTTEVLTEGVSIQRDAALKRAEAIQAGADAELAAFEARNLAILESDRQIIDQRLALQIQAAEGAAVVSRQQAENDIRDADQRAKAIAAIDAQLVLDIANLRKAASDQQKALDDAETERLQEQAETELQIRRDTIQAKLNLEQAASLQALDLQRQLFELQREEQIKQAEQEIEDAEALRARLLLIESEYQKNLAAIQVDNSEKIAEARQDEAKASLEAGAAASRAAREQGKSQIESARDIVNSIADQIRARIREAIAVQISKALVEVPFPANIVVAGLAGVAVEALLSRLIPAFATGGRIDGGQPVRRSNGDNVLITARRGEVILNQRQQAALGGASTFRKIGVPGFATGGLVGGEAATNQVIETVSLQNALIKAIEELPAPVLDYSEFTTFTNNVNLTQSRAGATD